ncbi:MAG: hypothetical protein RL219_1098 [Actinomycetota bacterium]|jgi:hypothetical protein
MNRWMFRINGVARVNLAVLMASMSHNLRTVQRMNERNPTYPDTHPLFTRILGHVVAVADPHLDDAA